MVKSVPFFFGFQAVNDRTITLLLQNYVGINYPLHGENGKAPFI